MSRKNLDAGMDRRLSDFTKRINAVVIDTQSLRIIAAPSQAKLINLLIEERAKVIRLCNPRLRGLPVCDKCREQARREIENEVLK